ncbi:MAG: SBBP repeat-containing protein [Acidobacteriia bacterium]|nr:SBBP repeat-containing protein [Terriglobia bacterium]
MQLKLSNSRLTLPLISVVTGCLLVTVAAVALHLSPSSKPTRNLRSESSAQQTASAASRKQIVDAYGSLPLAFEANLGQTDPQVKYMARGRGYTLFLTADEAVLSLEAAAPKPAKSRSITGRTLAQKGSTKAAVVRMRMVGANAQPQVAAAQRLPGVSNYYIGNDSSKWQTGVPQFARVNYREIYPGVDLAYHGAQKQMEFDFLVNPGANPDQIAFKFSGVRQMRTDESGDLILASGAGDVRLHKPFAYQENNGERRPVDARFVMEGKDKVAFALADYARSRQLVIDPSVSYATYIGGTGEDQASAVAVDSATGDAYITGEAGGASFPGSGSYGGGLHDAYVFKLDSTGTTQLYSTLLGGGGDDSGNAIAIDGSGNAYIAGGTNSLNFPVTAGVFQTTLNGTSNAFVAKLDSSGSLAGGYATYLGGNNVDVAAGIAIDGTGKAYVTGQTTSNPFPTTLKGFQQTFGGNVDAFVTVLNATGTSPLVYSTYLGGTGIDNATAIAFSGSKIYITGNTIPMGGTAFPTTGAAFGAGGATDVFVAKLDSALSGASSLVYSVLFGGTVDENAYGIAVDSTGNAYITGSTTSNNLPVQNAFQTTLKGTQNAFVAKLNATATAPLVFSTYLGGSGTDTGLAIALDSAMAGNSVYVTGQTSSADFPKANATQASSGGGLDAFVSQFNAAGNALAFSTYLGGSGTEDVTSTGLSGGIAADSSGNIYVVGDTASPDFPTVSAFQAANGGGLADAFAAKFAPTAGFSVGVSPNSATVTSGQTTPAFTVTVSPTGGFSSAVALSCSGLPTASNCVFNPTSVAGGSGSSQLTITTTVHTTGSLAPFGSGRQGLFYAMLIVPGLALVGVGFGSDQSRKRKLMGFLVGCVVFSGLAFTAACSGGSSTPPPTSHGTPPGTYSVTVKGTSGGTVVNGTPAISLTVQ